MIRYLSTLALALAAAVAMIAAPAAKAEKVMVYREGQLVIPEDVADVLGNTRSIRLLDDAPAAPAKATVKTTAMATASRVSVSAHPSDKARVVRADANSAASALSLPVQFAFDSAEILPAARTQLDALAKGIKLLAPGKIVTVEGHTDASGSPAYNLELSRNRARAVRDYLVHEHGIDAARLKTVGYGPSQPIEDTDPYAAINRRVQFRGS
ncbi:Outer membrane protein and related peptidoglycan-associated (lipo)proteins [Variovorax sp. HW608]|uniref:OmpA family protein n=1 Tax=Variovorax sp. HW608 TaxID=1034889 RepID=UPI00081FBC58|nr:OmpA family protein [Variovorax sp. HW608]SCK24547.1 Outer membrane protein and related peptidoglycan-associated (lipo)proteins [Variovorax sp. HW608]